MVREEPRRRKFTHGDDVRLWYFWLFKPRT